VLSESVGCATHLIKALDQAEDKGPHLEEIQHFSHEKHKLILCSTFNAVQFRKHEGHQHPFCLAQDSKNRKCKACPKDNKRYVFVCTKCDFIWGIGCANLPLVARHKYDTHLLKFTYAGEDNCREYYCLICEEKRDPNHWFYYCKECNFSTHTECVLKNYPRFTIESTYKSEYHKHALTFVQKTNDSYQYCKGCYKYFHDEVALECSQCKFNVHPPRPYYPDCMWLWNEDR
jgi:hypothetical protein